MLQCVDNVSLGEAMTRDGASTGGRAEALTSQGLLILEDACVSVMKPSPRLDDGMHAPRYETKERFIKDRFIHMRTVTPSVVGALSYLSRKLIFDS